MRRTAAVCVFSALVAGVAPATEVELKVDTDGAYVFDVEGLPGDLVDALARTPPAIETWRRGFAVTSLDDDGRLAPVAALGRYQAIADRLRFVPRFPAVRGLAYEVRVDIAELAAAAGGRVDAIEPFVARITVPEDDRPRAVIEAVHPAVGRVPANLLRIYLHFSSPMARGEAYRHLRLVAADGAEVEAPFLELGEELWDQERRRFTLLFDPGRLKRGLRPHDEMGPPLVAGGSYLLLVDGDWRDVHGRPLAAGHRLAFSAGPEDRRSPRIDEWTLAVPTAGSRTPFAADFGEPLDHALALRLLRLLDASGALVDGEISIGAGDTSWRLAPSVAWQSGDYLLVADGDLEDLAGNSLRGVFDRDLEADEHESTVERFERLVRIRE